MGDEKLLKQVFNNIPPFYEVVATPLEEKTGSQTNPLTIQGLRKKLKLKNQKMSSGANNFGKNEGEETDIFAEVFKSKLNKYVKYGHKARNWKYTCSK